MIIFPQDVLDQVFLCHADLLFKISSGNGVSQMQSKA